MNKVDGDQIIRTLDLYFRGSITFERANEILHFAPRWVRHALADFDQDRMGTSHGDN